MTGIPLSSGLAVRYGEILAHTGRVSVIAGVVVASPALVALAYPSEWSAVPAFVLPGAGLALLGATLQRRARPPVGRALGLADGSVVVLLSWVLAVIAGVIPFVTVGGLDVTGAIFESTSGWTTTGLTVVDVGAARPSILLLRSVLQLAGGAGLAILMLSALVGPSGTGLSAAEGRGEQLVPLVSRSASLVVRIYLSYVAIGILVLRWAGMGWFDAVNHAFTALSTGGFSTRVDSIGYWDSGVIEVAILPLMALGNLSFVTAFALLRGRWRTAFTNGEVRVFALLVAAGVAVLLLGVGPGLFPDGRKALRVGVFEAVTAVTTTGFSTVAYGDWPAVGWWTLIALMIVGGGTGSTAGGLKQHRVHLLFRYLRFDLLRRVGPRRLVNEPFLRDGGGRRFVGDREVAQVGMFVFLYLTALALGTGVLAGYGHGLHESLFEFASALGTVGLSVGVTSPSAPDGVLWTMIGGMLLGRLEFFTIFVAAARLIGDARVGVIPRRMRHEARTGSTVPPA